MEIIQEMLLTRTSERQGRVIDHDQEGSMEKKVEGLFLARSPGFKAQEQTP
jgi:sulfate adenylyltransferase subunit 2